MREAALQVPEPRAVRWTRALRHPLRALAMGMAALGVAWGLAVTPALVAVGLAAVMGVALGEWLGRSELRTGALVSAAAAVAALGLGVGWATTGVEPVASWLGAASALEASSVARWGFGGFAIVFGSRAMAVRRPAWRFAEVLLVVLALAWVFAAHRDGAIARPLWVSDWAWRRGMDPANVFLAVGAVGAAVQALLLLLERKGGVTLASLALLPLLATLALLLVEYTGRPTPKDDDGIGLIRDDQGDAPNATPERDRGPAGEDPKERPEGGGQGQGGADGGVGQTPGGGPDGGQGQPSTADGGTPASPRDGGAGEQRTDGGTAGERPPPPPRESSLDDTARPTEGSAPVPMAVVVFENDYAPPSEGYYFRQGAWSDWNGTRLVPSSLPGANQDILGEYPTKRVMVEAPPATGRTAVSARIALMADHEGPFGLETPISFEPVRNPNPDRFTRVYRARSLAQKIDYQALVGKRAGNPAWPEAVRAEYLEPHPDERYQRLAEEITAKLPEPLKASPFAKAAAIKVWLDKELTYSTRERHAGVADPTTHFLFGNRVGYCVHFAHATVFLWRSLGIPARVGTGYMAAAETRGGGSSLVLRNSDAHAWPELYLEGVGWVVLDISAQNVLDQATAPMDEDLQRMLGEMAREPDPLDEAPLEDKPREKGALLKMAAAVLGLAAALLLLGLYALKLWRRVAYVVLPGARGMRAAYLALLDALADQGVTRHFGETREQFALRVKDQVPSLPALTRAHVAHALGRDPAALETPDARATFLALARTARAEAARAAPHWRRLLGALHPYNYLRVK